MYLNQM